MLIINTTKVITTFLHIILLINLNSMIIVSQSSYLDTYYDLSTSSYIRSHITFWSKFSFTHFLPKAPYLLNFSLSIPNSIILSQIACGLHSMYSPDSPSTIESTQPVTRVVRTGTSIADASNTTVGNPSR